MHFSILLAVSFAFILLCLAVWLRQREWTFLVGFGFLYYWSLFGGWMILYSKRAISGPFLYLEQKLFPVSLDESYTTTLVLYSVFVLTAQITVLLTGGTRTADRQRSGPAIELSHFRLLAIAFPALFLSYWLMLPYLSIARASGTSSYLATRFSASSFYTLHQLLDQIALFPAAVGVAALMSGAAPRYVSSGFRWRYFVGYVFLFCAFFLFSLRLGNRGELFIGCFAGVLFYLCNSRRPAKTLLLATIFISILAMVFIERIRSLPAGTISMETLASRLPLNSESVNSLLFSTEGYAAHLSMYGVVRKEVKPRIGYSLVSLTTSLVPRAVWPSRPTDIYEYYAASVGAVPGQGYTIHHATGWYLNFGPAGVLLASVVLSLVWVFLHWNRGQLIRYPKILRVSVIVAPVLFTAYLPSLLRGGIEAYKAVVFESLIIPCAILTLAAKRRPSAKLRLILTPRPDGGDER